MILADTGVWIDHLRKRDIRMQQLLEDEQIVMHPFIVAELALGSLHDRRRTLSQLESLWEVKVARISEVRRVIEAHKLYSKGIGFVDIHLLASCLITPQVSLWTRDTALNRAAKSLSIQSALS